jgi:hypothetical protein
VDWPKQLKLVYRYRNCAQYRLASLPLALDMLSAYLQTLNQTLGISSNAESVLHGNTATVACLGDDCGHLCLVSFLDRLYTDCMPLKISQTSQHNVPGFLFVHQAAAMPDIGTGDLYPD